MLRGGPFSLLPVPVTSSTVTDTALRTAIRSLFAANAPLSRQCITPIRPADGLFCSAPVAVP